MLIDKEIKIHIRVKQTYDKHTKSFVIYNTRYNISGYGKTKKKARKMFETMIHEVLKFEKKKSEKHR